MALYHKYRPDTLDGVFGNKEIVSTLVTMLENEERMPHTFLFSGPSGCGKTTFARIIANTLGVHDEDYIENNASNERGIDATRLLINNSAFKPLKSKYRIYLLDECHELTKNAQNALLKILEDTPSHVIFILCTTDPQKLLTAIKNRCSQYTVKPLDDSEMLRLLRKVSRAEKDKPDKEVLEQIVKSAEGHSRHALQILDQVLAAPEEDRLEIAKKAELLQNEVIDLCRALINGKSWKTIAPILEGLKQEQPETIRRIVLGYSQAVLLKSGNPRAALIMEEFLEPTYDSGFSQIVYTSYSVING